jgi:ligand-binding sensor domain-containing protein/signal transduction histidine kinase
MPRIPLVAVVSLIPLIAAPVTRAERLPIKTYSTADGLPRDQIRYILPDSRGFLWFCTGDGLSRYDGYEFTTYGVEHGLPHPFINHMLESRHGIYWIATNGGGVARFDPTERGKSHFATYPVGENAATNRVNIVYEDQAGTIWAGTDAGLFRLDEANGTGRFRRVPFGFKAGESTAVHAFVEDSDRQLWIGTQFGLFRRSADGSMVHHDLRPADDGDHIDHIQALLRDRGGRIWVGHQAGMLVFKPAPGSAPFGADTPTLIEYRWRAGFSDRVTLPSVAGDARWYSPADKALAAKVWALHERSDGHVWIGVTLGEGLLEFDGERLRRYSKADGLPGEFINALAEDRYGNMWVATELGAARIAWNGFTSYSETDGLASGNIASILQGPGDALFAMTPPFINRFDGHRFTPVRPNCADNPRSPVWGWNQISFQDRVGDWWVNTAAGVCRFANVKRFEQLARDTPRAVYASRNGLPTDDVFRLFEDAKSDVWIGTIGPHPPLTRWERSTGRLYQYGKAEGVPAAAAMAFQEDRTGALWIGFAEAGGLTRFQHGRFSYYAAADGVPAGEVRALHLDRRGALWIATSLGGLGCVQNPAADRPRFMTYSTANGLASNTIWSLTEDDLGRIYIGTLRGIDRLDPATGQIRHYTMADGLPSREIRVAGRDAQGNLWFGTPRGLARLVVRPDRPTPPPPILISGLNAAGESYPLSPVGEQTIPNLKLASQQNRLAIGFLGLGFGADESLRYEFKLEGADREWSAPTTERRVNYATLSPGAYRFMVRAVAADGTRSVEPATVAFTILPPIWRRRWFVTLASVFVATMLLFAHRLRVARLVELERIRTRIATDLHDDIGSSLSRMAILSEVVKREIGATHAAAASRLTDMAQTARDLVDTMSDIVWSIDPRRDDLRNVVARIREFATAVLEPQGIHVHWNVPSEFADVKLNPDQRRDLFLVCKEAINNVARHADCTSVWVTFTVSGRSLAVAIRDDGRGFDTNERAVADAETVGGNGLKNISQRAQQLGGRSHLVSAPGAGTCLTVAIPLP